MKEGRGIGTTEHLPRPAGTAGRAVPILLVEDNPGDIRLTREALRGCGITNPVDMVKPPTFTEFAHAINGIGAFWLDLVTLPPAAAAVGQ